MKRRLKEPFGKAGLTVAVIALVMALVGGAYAAGGLTKSQEKQVTKIAKKYAGKPGATGPAGLAGTNGTNGKDGAPGTAGKDGTNGTNGTDGADGTNGKSVTVTEIPTGEFECDGHGGATVEEEGAGPGVEVCNGQTGFTKTLPSGETETGMWGLIAHTPEGAANDLLGNSVSFNIPLSAAPSAHYIAENEEELTASGEQPSTACLGSAANPTATEGNLCVYAASEGGVSTNEAFNNFLMGWKWGISVVGWGDGENAPDTSTPVGFGIRILSEGETTVRVQGSWAVTAG